MNGFVPPPRLLDLIGADPRGGIQVTTGTPSVKRERYSYMIDWPWMTVIAYYGKERQRFAVRCATIAHEAFMNAAEHGNNGEQRKKIRMLLWPGSRGALFGIRDEGSYFRAHAVKLAFESRTPQPSSRSGSDPKGRGLPIIYGADEIFVSPSQRALYAAIMMEAV